MDSAHGNITPSLIHFGRELDLFLAKHSVKGYIASVLVAILAVILIFQDGGGNRIVACNPYHRLIYVFSIFNVPANVPADLLDAIGLL